MRTEDRGADSLEHIRAGVFGNDDLLTRESINETFDKMDEEIWMCMSYLLDAPTRFVEHRLSEVAIRAMGNMTYNRVLFNKDEFTPEEWMTLSGKLLHLTATRKTLASSVPAFLTRSRTRPSELRSSKTTTRIMRSPTRVTCRLSR